MKSKKNKKGIELTLSTVIIAVLLIAVMVIVLLVFGKYFGLEVGILGGHISGLECDADSDGVKDLLDACPCDPDTDKKPCLKECNEDIAKACKAKKQEQQNEQNKKESKPGNEPKPQFI